jgi:hypothetical protein
MAPRILFTAIFGFLLFFAAPARAQQEPPTLPPIEHHELTPEEQQQACAACGGGMMILLLFVLLVIGLKVFMAVWVARDAKNRGVTDVALWVLLVIFLNLIGLIIYLCSRPAGDLMECLHCRGKRLRILPICPHCRRP